VPEIIDDSDDITPAWLSEVLESNGVQAKVARVSVSAIGTGQMGSCYRVAISYQSGQGPEHLVVKLPSAEAASRSAGATGYRTEVLFYKHLAPGFDVNTPRSWLAAVESDGSRFTLVMQDMAPAEQGDQIAGCTADQAKTAACNVARLHAATWNSPALEQLDWLIPPVYQNAGMTSDFLTEATKTFIARYGTSPEDAAVLQTFAERFAGWANGRLAPFSLVHNDYRLDNLLFSPPGHEVAVAAVDWQVLTVGLPARDVAFLLATGMEPAERRTWERSVVDAYHGILVSRGVAGYSDDDCWEDYRYALFQGLLITVLGAYVARPTERGDRMFKIMVERSAEAIRDLDALSLI
jgi:hypothetical protein